MADVVQAVLTNLDVGPRGVPTAAGVVMIDAGAAAAVELAPADLERALATGWFAALTADAPAKGRRAR